MPPSIPDAPTPVPDPTPAPEQSPPPPETPARAGRFVGAAAWSLRVGAARGMIVNAGFNVAVQAITAARTLVLAGLLTLDEYGLWALLTVTLGTLLWLGAVGLDDKYIQQDHPDQEEAFQIAFTLQALLCAAFMGVIAVAVPLFALAYARPELVAPGLALGLAMPAIALQTPLWVFYRRMDFVRQRRLQLWEPIASLILVIGLALAGFGVWAAVLATLGGSWVAAIVALRASPYRVRLKWKPGAAREYTSYSWPLFLSSASAVITVQVPVLVASRALGLEAVAAISLAAAIATFANRVDGIVTGTLYPAICAVRDQLDLLFEVFSKSNRLALLWALPCGAGVVLFAGDFVDFVLGEKWRSAVLLIQVTGATAALNQIGFNWTAFFRARGTTRPIAVADATVGATVLAVGVPLLATEGLTAYAAALAGATVLSIAIRFAFLARLFPVLRIAAHVARAVWPTVPAVGVVLLIRLGAEGRSPGRALAEVCAFLAVCGLCSLASERRLLAESLGYLRGRVTPAVP